MLGKLMTRLFDDDWTKETHEWIMVAVLILLAVVLTLNAI